MPMKCLYCDEDYYRNSSLRHSLFSKDLLCEKCRNKLKINHRYLQLDKYEVECFYEYDEEFRSLIVQYKECFDEALKDVFISPFKHYLNIRYHGYTVVWVPSSKRKVEARGFDHMEKILEQLSLKKCNALYQIEDMSQKNKNYQERAKMQNNIKAKTINAKKVLLVDDVITSGASMLSAAKALEESVTVMKLLSLSCTKEWNV